MWWFRRKKRPVAEWPADRPMPESLKRAIEASRGAPPAMKAGDIITREEMQRNLGCLLLCNPFAGKHVCGR